MIKKGLFLFACTLMVAACGNKSSSNNNNGSSNGQVATTALDSCFNGTAPAGANCTNVAWANYSRYGFYGYGNYGIQPQYWNNVGYYQYSMGRYNPAQYGGVANYAAFCSCGRGSRPVYLPQGGLGCVSAHYVPDNALYYGMGANNQFVLNAQFSMMSGFNVYLSGANRSCYQNVASACHVGTNECGQTAVCTATTNDSPIGICVSTVQQQPRRDCRDRRCDHWDRDGRDDDRRGRYDDRRDDGRQYGGYSSSGSITSGGGVR